MWEHFKRLRSQSDLESGCGTGWNSWWSWRTNSLWREHVERTLGQLLEQEEFLTCSQHENYNITSTTARNQFLSKISALGKGLWACLTWLLFELFMLFYSFKLNLFLSLYLIAWVESCFFKSLPLNQYVYIVYIQCT